MLSFFYRIGIELYFLLLKFVSIKNKKAAELIEGQKLTFKSLQNLPKNGNKRIWFHCASLGEFEQAKPVIEKIKDRNPDVFIAITFFSPSGYSIAKSYLLADWVGYLPKDTPRNAEKFFGLLQPSIAVFVKYEIWPFYLKHIQAKIPTFLISAKFYKGGVLNPFVKSLYWPILNGFTKIFLQDPNSFNLLKNQNLSNIELSGDTRVERVLSLKNTFFDSNLFDSFKRDSKLLILGSSWEKEENLLLETLPKLPETYKVIIVPHDVNRSKQIKNKFSAYNSELFSEFRMGKVEWTRVLIIDSIGILSKLYRMADIAFVGGGYSNALHNIFEPAVYGVPVLYGPNSQKYPEGELFEKQGIGFRINSYQDLISYTQKDSDFFEKVKVNSTKFFSENQDVCNNIVNQILKD